MSQLNCSDEVENNGTRLVAASGLFPDNPLLQICISIFNLANIVFVITISLKIDRRDVSRLYTLWLYFVNAPSDVVQIIISILQLKGLVDVSGNYYRDYIDVVQLTGKYFHDLAANVYRSLALILVTATFMCYAFPFSFARLFHPSRRNNLYLGGFLFIGFHGMMSQIQSALVIRYGECILPGWVYDVWYLSVQTITFIMAALLFMFYFLAIFVIVRYVRRRPIQANSNAIHRKQLMSVIVYATTPNIIVLNAVIANAMMIVVATTPVSERDPSNPIVFVGSIFNRIHRYLAYVRLPILTISTFIAFAAYRKSLLAMLPFQIVWRRGNQVNYKVRPSQTGSQTPASSSSFHLSRF